MRNRSHTAATKIQTAWRKKKAAAASARRVSQNRYTQTNMVSRVLKNFSELKLNAARLVNKSLTLVQPVTTRKHSLFLMNTGQDMSGLNPDFVAPNALDAFSFAQGDTANQRDGSYMYIKRHTGKLEIQACPIMGVASTNLVNNNLECRLVVVKANRKYNRYGNFPDPRDSLFLANGGGEFGWRTPDVGGTPMLMEYQHQPINKRKWIVYQDKKFVLAPAIAEGTAVSGTDVVFSTNGRHPSKRLFYINHPVNRKVHFVGNRPDDLDTQMLVILFVQKQVVNLTGPTLAPDANLVRINYVGTTSAYDN